MDKSPATRSLVLVLPGEGQQLDLRRAQPRILLSGQESEGRLAVLKTTQAPGGGPPLHTHAHEDETFFVLDGSFTFVCGDTSADVPAGSLAHLPRGVPHRYQAGTEGGTVLMLFTPSGMEGYFREWAALVAAGQMTNAAMTELAGHHGLQLHGSYLPDE